MATLTEQLSEARAAFHRLQIGEAAVRFTDQNGETVEYNRASAPRLAAYITTLKAQIAGQNRRSTVTFQTSKGLT